MDFVNPKVSPDAHKRWVNNEDYLIWCFEAKGYSGTVKTGAHGLDSSWSKLGGYFLYYYLHRKENAGNE